MSADETFSDLIGKIAGIIDEVVLRPISDRERLDFGASRVRL